MLVAKCMTTIHKIPVSIYKELYQELLCTCTAIVLLIQGWFSLATEATEAESSAESESKESSDLV